MQTNDYERELLTLGKLENQCLTLSDSTWKGPIYGSNRTVWYLNCVQTNDLCKIVLLEIELFDHLCVNKWLMFNWIVSDT